MTTIEHPETKSRMTETMIELYGQSFKSLALEWLQSSDYLQSRLPRAIPEVAAQKTPPTNLSMTENHSQPEPARPETFRQHFGRFDLNRIYSVFSGPSEIFLG